MIFDPMSVEVTCVTLPKDHCVQVPWQYINVCGYSDQFCKIPHTYTYIHTTYYVQNEWSHSLLLNSVQARQKGGRGREEHGDHGDDKLKSSKATEWGKLVWNWMRKNAKKKDKENCRIGKERKKRRGMKSSNKRKGGKCQGILRKSS